MKKAGELAKSFFVHGVFIALIVLALVIIISKGINLTGHAVLDSESAQQGLESALQSSSIFSSLLQSSVCIVINDAEQPVSLKAEKSSSGWTVTKTTGFCGGLQANDVVVQFPDYDAYSQIIENPSPRNIASGAKNQVFQVLESKFVELGGNVICDATFKVKYCSALETMATDSDLIEGDLVCCLDQLTKEQRKQLEEHLQQGNFEDEIGIIQQKAGSTGLLGSSFAMIGGGGLVAILLIVFVVMVVKGKSKKPSAKKSAGAGVAKPDAQAGAVPGAATLGAAMMQKPAENPQITGLRDYVKQSLLQGYAPDQIRGHLLEIGWDADTSDKILGEAYKQAQKELGQRA